MEVTLVILQVFVGLSILRVWLLRYQKESIYRAGDGQAKNLKEEFEFYGLPSWSLYTVGILKVAAALGLIVGVWIPQLVPYSAGALIFFMSGAVLMHLKVKDMPRTYFPALLFLILSLIILYLSTRT